MQIPKNIIDFSDIFHNEEVCLEYFEKLRWPDWVTCHVCWSLNNRKHKRGYFVCVDCRSDIHQTAGTVFHASRIPLRTLFWLVWSCVSSKQWVSSEELSINLWIGPKVAWQWLYKIRRIMVLDERTKLTGSVEVDEVFIWWKKSWKRWRWAEGKIKVVIAVEVNMENKNKKWFFRWMGRIRMKIINECNKKELHKFIQDNIETWMTVITDDWKWYCDLEKKWFLHIVEKHNHNSSESIWDSVEGVNNNEVTPNVHIVASLIKRWLLWTHQQYLANGWYLQPYLEEYTFRYNRRKSKSRGTLFLTMMEQIAKMPPTTLKEIMKKGS